MSSSALRAVGNGFVLDGDPFRIVSGALHYFRIHPEQWGDRLIRLRHLGLNTVDVYVPWNFHQPRHEECDFTGWRDVAAFIALAGELGFKVLLRPGPYIAAEWDFGGFPAWLLAEPGLTLRCSDPGYQRHIASWFAELLPRLVHLQHERGGPIIAVQVENEYGTYGNDRAHLEWLADTIRGHGFSSLLFCNSGVENDGMLRGGNLPGVLSSVDFEGAPEAPFALLETVRPGGPLLCSEHWIGWFDHWGDPIHHTADPDEVARNVDAILARGASLNLYMAAGGTNFGWTAGATINERTGRYQPVTTSYDYDAPIAEDGRLTNKFHALREVIGRYHELPSGPCPAAPATMPPQQLSTEGGTSLLGSLDRLGTWQQHLTPPTMEQLGNHQGLVLYRTELDGPRSAQPLTVPGLGDRATVFLEGQPIGHLDRNNPRGSAVQVAVDAGQSQLDILVDSSGRVNYGPRLRDPKGISGPVLLGTQALFGWQVCPLPLDDLSALDLDGEQPPRPGHPHFQRHALQVPQRLDAHLAFPGYGHVLVWVNDQPLGRWWNVGPQQTLYAPAPLWQPGRNTVTVLTLDGQPGAVSVAAGPSWTAGPTKNEIDQVTTRLNRSG